MAVFALSVLLSGGDGRAWATIQDVGQCLRQLARLARGVGARARQPAFGCPASARCGRASLAAQSSDLTSAIAACLARTCAATAASCWNACEGAAPRYLFVVCLVRSAPAASCRASVELGLDPLAEAKIRLASRERGYSPNTVGI